MQRILTDFSGRCWRLLDQRNLKIVDVSVPKKLLGFYILILATAVWA